MNEWVFAIIGGVIFIIALICRIRVSIIDSACTQSVKAKIVSIHKERSENEDSKGRTRVDYYFHPIYEFDFNGKKHKVFCKYGSGRESKFKEGNFEKINYNPDNPDQISTKFTRRSSRKLSGFFMFVGLLFILVNVLAVLKY